MKAADGLSQGDSRPQTSRRFEGLPEGLSCPRCRGGLAGHGKDARCSGCGRSVVIHGGRIPDFIAGSSPVVADTILGWSDRFLQEAAPSLLALASGGPLPAEACAQLEANQLLRRGAATTAKPARRRFWRLDQGTRLTALGSNLAYHCTELSLQSATDQAGRFLERFAHLSALAAQAAVLDVGCGAGQTLRQLRRYQPAERIGLDIDLEALAFGCRLAESQGDGIRFVRGSAYEIPFRDHRFSHLICRVALNYMHQRRALREMVRVLRTGGFLYCAVEGPGFDFHFLQQARTAGQVLCRLRDLVYGFGLALTSLQPVPGSRLSGGRLFGTLGRCTRILARAGCQLVHAQVTARYLGMPMLFELVARKDEKAQR